MTIDEKILEIRNSGPVTRSHIAELLTMVGKPGQKRSEKIEVVRQLNLENSQAYRVEDNLDDYQEF